MSARTITVMTHGRPPRPRGAPRAGGAGRARGAVLALDAEETAKHALAPGVAGMAPRSRSAPKSTCASPSAATARSCGHFVPTPGPPSPCSRWTSARSGSSPRWSPSGCGRDLSARSPERWTFSASRRSAGRGGAHTALNDVSVHRKVGGRVAELSYAVSGEEIGSVRCDGLVVATPGGLDRLQPRQRGSGDGLGGGGNGRLVHRPALPERTRPRDRARRRARVPQQLARGARRLGRRAPGRRDRAAGSGARAVRAGRRVLAQMDGRASTGACGRSSVASRASPVGIPAPRVPSPPAGRPCCMLLELSRPKPPPHRGRAPGTGRWLERHHR